MPPSDPLISMTRVDLDDMSFNPDPLLTVQMAADYLSVGRSTMYEIIKQHRLETVRVTSDIRIRRSVLEAYIKSRSATRQWTEAGHW